MPGVQVSTFLHNFQSKVHHILVAMSYPFESLDRAIDAFADSAGESMFKVI